MSGSQFGFFGTDPWWMVILKAVLVDGNPQSSFHFRHARCAHAIHHLVGAAGCLPDAKPDRTKPRGATRPVAVLNGRL